MPGRATATVVFYIIGTGEKAYIFIDGVDMIPQLVTAVGAVQQIRKDALFAILRFRRTALCPLDDLLLYLLKGVPVDNRLVNILEDCGSAIIVPTLKLAMCFFQELGQSVKPP